MHTVVVHRPSFMKHAVEKHVFRWPSSNTDNKYTHNYELLFFCFSVPPQGAKISAPSHPLTSGRTYDISCSVWGSNPPARVEWYQGTRQEMRPLHAFNQTVRDGGNLTVSWIRFAPEPERFVRTTASRCTCRRPFRARTTRL